MAKKTTSEYYTVLQVCMKSTTLKMFEHELKNENKKLFNKRGTSKILFDRLKESYLNNPPEGYKAKE